MIEFLWVLLLVASFVGALNYKPRDVTRRARVRSCIAQRWRWWLLVGFLVLVAGVYLWENILRALLNLLLFFDRHNVFMMVLLAVSLVGFMLAWRKELTAYRVLAAIVLGATVASLLALGWYRMSIGLLFLSLFGLLLAQRERLPTRLVWSTVLLTTSLVAGLLLSAVLYDESGVVLDVGDSLFIAGVCIVTAVALLWAWKTQAYLFASSCGLLLVLLIGGLTYVSLGNAVPTQVGGVADALLLVVLVVLASSAFVWVRAVPLQPLGLVSAVMIVFLGGGLFLSSILYGEPEDFADIEDQFKYGSIGSDHFLARGIPYLIWDVLPEMFPPEKILLEMAERAAASGKPVNLTPRYGAADGPRGRSYQAFGLLREEDRTARLLGGDKQDVSIERPIGFSKRNVFGIDFVGINCAFCHASTLRASVSSPPQIVLGMPANTTDIELFFQFLFGAAEQERFAPRPVMREILGKHPELAFGRPVGASGIRGIGHEISNALKRLAYRVALIRLTRMYITRLRHDFYFINTQNPKRIPRFGPGRVDAWNPGKTTLVNPPLPVKYPGGIIDHTSIWNQNARSGLQLHWDGNIDVLAERNIVAGLVVNGPNVECLDTQRLARINKWINARPAPRIYDFQPELVTDGYDAQNRLTKVERGGVIFQHWCASCHAPNGDRVGQVEPLDGGVSPAGHGNHTRVQLDTDPARMLTFTADLANALNTIGTDQWQLRNFKAQKGYANMLLDGIWLRAPYLHNGSVPTLRDLLNKPCDGESKPSCRPSTFYRGQDLYDWKRVGFKYEKTIEPGDTVDVTFRDRPPATSIPVDENGMLKVYGVEHNVWGLTAAEAGEAILVELEAGALMKQTKGLELAQARAEARMNLREKALKLVKRENGLTDNEAKEWVRHRIDLATVRIHERTPTKLFAFSTAEDGNSNKGHLYGTDLTAEEKDDLIAYLKTL